MKFATLFTVIAFAASGKMVHAWSGYCYDCTTLKPETLYTDDCCRTGRDGPRVSPEYRCWEMSAAQKDTFLSCCNVTIAVNVLDLAGQLNAVIPPTSSHICASAQVCSLRAALVAGLEVVGLVGCPSLKRASGSVNDTSILSSA
ncbi:hypothetical protein D9619_007448 [Psilocybe cf. subviscida]|uniref:Hydrophobin n=1 Tax=Psilocybe cf. subviscida TaxID=2480587 RepID=A0A8H5B2J2_9AGAR|nr:hypothetical protein D9619_007448 [Psilocybe cf. subviscida]